MSENLETPDVTGDAGDRRNFLSRSGLMLALLAIAGEGTAEAADTMVPNNAIRFTGVAPVTSQEAKPLSDVLNTAIKLGKVDTTSPAYLKLSPALRGSLGSLSAADLRTLASAQQILGSRIKANLDDNNGTIGM
jgi:hypothetical protein